MACYEPPFPPPPTMGTISDMFKNYNDLQGTGLRKNWAALANEMMDLAKTHSYAKLLTEAKTAKKYELAVAAAGRRDDLSDVLAGDIGVAIDEFKRVNKVTGGPPGRGFVDVGPSLPKTGDYLVQKPDSLSPYERWVFSRKAAFVNRNKIPHLEDSDEDDAAGFKTAAETGSVWTEAALKRNRLVDRRNFICDQYNGLADECTRAVMDLLSDKAYVMEERTRLLASLVRARESTSYRRYVTMQMEELHEFINDTQFEIFKLEQIMMELNSIATSALYESDVITKARKKVVQNIDPKLFRYAKSLVSQKSDMYAEYRERIEVLADICEEIVAPISKGWKKVGQIIKACVILTKAAVSNLTSTCPLHAVIKEELKKANTEYSQDDDSLEQLGKDDSVLTTITQIDTLFKFLDTIKPYLRTEAMQLTANLENREIIRAWKEIRPTPRDDDCT